MSATTKATAVSERRPCRADVEWTPCRSRGVHALLEKLTGAKCEGAGHCVAESHLFAPERT